MRRTLTDARRWMRDGSVLFLDAAARLGEDDYREPSELPGWTRKHLVAHVAANAEALGNLIRWAVTGTPTPMYASPDERAATIEKGSQESGEWLDDWLRRSAGALAEAMDRLGETAWTASVRTAQGRTVPGSEIPWMRSREVWVHAVDLRVGVTFADLPADLLLALCDDVAARRGDGRGPGVVLVATDTSARWDLPGTTEPVTVTGPLSEIAAYLTGREHLVSAVAGTSVPVLPAWL